MLRRDIEQQPARIVEGFNVRHAPALRVGTFERAQFDAEGGEPLCRGRRSEAWCIVDTEMVDEAPEPVRGEKNHRRPSEHNDMLLHMRSGAGIDAEHPVAAW